MQNGLVQPGQVFPLENILRLRLPAIESPPFAPMASTFLVPYPSSESLRRMSRMRFRPYELKRYQESESCSLFIRPI